MSVRVKSILVLIATALLGAALAMHASWLNGPSYWKWPWRNVPTLRLYPAMLAAAIPLFTVAHFARLKPIVSVLLLMVSMFAMQVAAVAIPEEPATLRKVVYTVESPTNLSYFSDADRTMDISTAELLARYPAYMPQFSMHSQEKPPGPILFFRAILGVFGASDQTALIAGLLIGALATLAIPATYLLIKALTGDATAALFGACFIALAPGLVLHLPQMDQLYPIVTCALIIAWWKALRENSQYWASAFGLALALACFIVYHFLVLGAFLAAITVTHLIAAPRKRAVEIAKCVLIAIAALVAFYLLHYVLTGFNPIATFVEALRNQREHLKHLHRPYPKTILDDLQDFALGSGWIAWILVIFLLTRARSTPKNQLVLALLCIGQIVLLAVTGLMQTETARTWCFLLPLLAIPVGLELATWPRTPRLVAIVAMWLILGLVAQNMKFIFLPAEQLPFMQQPQPAL
jgi:hypothetical protein